MSRIATLRLEKESFCFAAGHFAIFSETQREPLHGHNYRVSLQLDVEVNDNGMTFDYNVYKSKIISLCKIVDQTFLLPSESPYMTVEKIGDQYRAHFNQEKIPFLCKDVTLLPVRNITVEELSHWFLQQLLLEQDELDHNSIQALSVRVYSGAGQWGASSWQRTKG